jgi:hypothetical protein
MIAMQSVSGQRRGIQLDQVEEEQRGEGWMRKDWERRCRLRAVAL